MKPAIGTRMSGQRMKNRIGGEQKGTNRKIVTCGFENI